MTFTGILAQSTVADLESALDWYGRLFGRPADTTPMPGLHEWHIDDHAGLQVWQDPSRAGRGTVVIASADLDASIAALDAAGLTHSGAEPASGSRIVRLTDPDGNLVVLTGA